MSIQDLQQNQVTLPTPSEVDKIRYPDQVFTDSYLNDPIQYNIDRRFIPTPLVEQIQETQNVVKRDFASFLQVQANKTDAPQYVAFNTFSHRWNREAYMRIIGDRRIEFTELGQ